MPQINPFAIDVNCPPERYLRMMCSVSSLKKRMKCALENQAQDTADNQQANQKNDGDNPKQYFHFILLFDGECAV